MRKVKLWIIRSLRDSLFVLAIGLSVSTIFSGFDLWKSIDAFKRVGLYSFVIGITLWKGNQAVGYMVDYFHPWSRNPKRTLLFELLASLLYSSVAILVVNYFLFPLLYGGSIHSYPRHFYVIGVMQLFIALLITSIFYVKQFFNEWLKASINEEKLKQEAIQLRYNALKSNVNPHFLFNSLSVLTALIETDLHKAKEFIGRFSSIYRYVLESRDTELVPLANEIQFIQSYAELHQIRHGSHLNVHIAVEDTSGYIVPLSMQILMENCLKHNIISEEKPLNVRIWRSENYIFVENNLQKRKTIPEVHGMGLENISKQFEYLTNAKVEINQTAQAYTVKLPVIVHIK